MAPNLQRLNFSGLKKITARTEQPILGRNLNRLTTERESSNSSRAIDAAKENKGMGVAFVFLENNG